MAGRKKSKFELGKLITALLLPQLAGLVGSLFTFSAITSWYQYLNKPELSPPNWIFGPVWTSLYLMMGLSLFLVWKKGVRPTLFIIHLVVNSLWSIAFFGLRSPALGLVIIEILWALIVALIIQFNRHSKLAAALLLPYLVWVSFASYLNWSIYILNK